LSKIDARNATFRFQKEFSNMMTDAPSTRTASPIAQHCTSETHLLQSLIYAAPSHMAYVTKEGNWGYVNPAAAAILGQEIESLVGKHISQSRAHDHPIPLIDTVSRVLETGLTHECDTLAPHAEGESARWVHLRVSAYKNEAGELLGALIFSRDIHEQKIAEATAYTQNQLIERHLDNGHLAFIQMDRSFKIERWSRAAERVFGWSEAEAVGRTAEELCGIHPEDFKAVRSAWLKTKYEGEEARVHLRHRNFTKSGALIWCDWYGSMVNTPDFGQQSFLCFAIDVTERVETRLALAHAANRDSLTQMPNRYAFYDWLSDRLNSEAPEGSVLFVDLDGFKEVNDRYGHKTGDQLLLLVAARLDRLIGVRDCVARYGGDEFVLFGAADTSSPPVSIVAEKIITELRRPFAVGELEIELSCSVGIAKADNENNCPQTLVTNADLAMYEAKSNGKDQFVHYSEHLGERHRVRAQLHAGLREALRAGHISVFYQARVAFDSKQVLGAEALARWTTKDGRGVGPNDFIPAAEETGLIHDLGAYVLQHACEFSARVNAQRLTTDRLATPFVVSVNLSTVQLRQPQFVKRVKSIFASAKCKPEWIEFEVTESRALTDAVCLARLDELVTRFGASCSLDDFGTGYSNLVELTLLPLSALKIDRGFVSTLSPTNTSVIASVLALAQSMDLEVVAEGVETQAQFEQLRAMGCTSFQGYLHSRPMPSDHFLAALSTNRFIALT
jgi:diguanylate cyclase (GGDEF)-like protein/PAS domain S-box-containing protein